MKRDELKGREERERRGEREERFASIWWGMAKVFFFFWFGEVRKFGKRKKKFKKKGRNFPRLIF